MPSISPMNSVMSNFSELYNPACRLGPGSTNYKLGAGTAVNCDAMTKMETIPQHILEQKAARDAALASSRPPSASEKIAARDDAARQRDPIARYQAALGFGPDFVTYMNNNINIMDEYGFRTCSDDLMKTSFNGQTSTHVSAQGTVIGVERTKNDTGPQINTIQITRKDGFQVNLALNDDLRINDLEDGGLSIYYASSGLTRIFDAEGNESTFQGEKNVLGTSAADITINTFSKDIDAGDGDDTIINFANDVKISGGEGNDKILLLSDTARGVSIDGGAGNDTIVGHFINNSTIAMDEGNDSLTSRGLHRTTISSSGNDTIKTEMFYESKLVHQNGIIGLDIAGILESSLTIDKAKPFSTDGLRGSNLKFGDGNVSLHTKGILRTHITTGKGNDVITASGGIDNSDIYTGAGNDTVKITNSARDSNINTGKGDDTVIFENDVRWVSVTEAEHKERSRG